MHHYLWLPGFTQQITGAGGEREDRSALSKLILTRHIFDSISIAVAVATPDGRILCVNTAYESLFGLPADEPSSPSPGGITDSPNDIRDTWHEDLAFLRGGEFQDEFVQAIDAHGTSFLVWQRLEILRDAAGIVHFILMIMRRMEAPDGSMAPPPGGDAASFAERPYQNSMSCSFTPDGIITSATFPFCLYFGGSRDQLLGTPFLSLFSPPSVPKFRDDLMAASRLGRSVVSVRKMETSDGRTAWQHWTHRPVYDDGRRLTGFQSNAFRIARQVWDGRNLWKTFSQFRGDLLGHTRVIQALFERNVEVMLVLDFDTLDIVDANPSACRFYGYSRDEMRDMSLLSINIEDREALRAKQQLALEGRQNRFTLRHRLSSGELRDVESYVSCADVGERRLTFSIIHDLTERNRIQSALRAHEEEAKRKGIELEEVNTALRVLLSSREEGRKELEESIVTNVRTLVMPHLDMLAETTLNQAQRVALDAIREHLREIVSPLLPRLSTRFSNLSPMELRVARLIKDGRRNKEIAQVLGVSENTILTHRYHLRSKLGLKGHKMNLQTFLASILDQ